MSIVLVLSFVVLHYMLQADRLAEGAASTLAMCLTKKDAQSCDANRACRWEIDANILKPPARRRLNEASDMFYYVERSLQGGLVTIAPNTGRPTTLPTVKPSRRMPTRSPTPPTTAMPTPPTTNYPTRKPTKSPTISKPTKSPTLNPTTPIPSSSPSTSLPSPNPTVAPTNRPTPPTKAPTSRAPTTAFPTPPTRSPTQRPTTSKPSRGPTIAPTTWKPSRMPTSSNPTKSPQTFPPTHSPTSSQPTRSPTSSRPSKTPTTSFPTKVPTLMPTARPTTVRPTPKPVVKPTTKQPTARTTILPTSSPVMPTALPSTTPTITPETTIKPTFTPSTKPRTRSPTKKSKVKTKTPTRLTLRPSTQSPSNIGNRTSSPSRSSTSKPSTLRPSALHSPTMKTGSPSFVGSPTPDPICLPRCSTYKSARACPKNQGCAWLSSKRCGQVRGGQAMSKAPTQSPVSSCRFQWSMQATTESLDQITFSVETGKFMVATTFSSNTAILFDTENVAPDKKPNVLAVLGGHSDKVVSAAFSADERLLATASLDRTSRVFSTNDGGLVFALSNGHLGAVIEVAFPTISGFSVVVTASHDSTAVVWSLDNGSVLARLVGHSAPLSRVSFLPSSGKRVATASYDGRILIWDIDTRRTVLNLTHTDPVYGMAISADGELIAGSSLVISLWHVSTGSLLHRLSGHVDIVRTLAFSSFARYLVSLAVEDAPILWDVSSGAVISTFDSDVITSDFAFTMGGNIVTVTENGIQTWTSWGAGPFTRATTPANGYWSAAAKPSTTGIIVSSFDGSLAYLTCA